MILYLLEEVGRPELHPGDPSAIATALAPHDLSAGLPAPRSSPFQALVSFPVPLSCMCMSPSPTLAAALPCPREAPLAGVPPGQLAVASHVLLCHSRARASSGYAMLCAYSLIS